MQYMDKIICNYKMHYLRNYSKKPILYVIDSYRCI